MGIFDRGIALADKILKDAKPSDLPMEYPTKFELANNVKKMAKMLGPTIPQTLSSRADEAIR